ncbi:MAG: SURF1 family protein [Pseudomonadota bacterium]
MAEPLFAGRRFRPKPGATIAAGIAFLILIALGVWQIERLGWKENLIAERHERSTAPAIELPAPGADISQLDFRHARAEGTFDHAQEMYLAARSMNGNPGYHVVTPLDLADGRVLLVDRGWIPIDRKDPARRAEGQVQGPVAVEGLLRLPRPKSWLEPDNQPAENMWYWMELPAMAAHLGLPAEKLVPVYMEAGPAPNPGGFPIGGQSRTELRNDHLQYAITWFGLAVALAVIWFLYHWKKPEEEGGGAAR